MSLPRAHICSIIAVICLASFPLTSFAQGGGPRPSLMATVSQRLGTDTDITVVYSRPGVKGRVIWGDLVAIEVERRRPGIVDRHEIIERPGGWACLIPSWT